MENRKFYIIGNGFDLWHGIPSSYGQFKKFVREHDFHLLEAVENYLPADDNWSDLEFAIGKIDAGNIIDDFEHFMMSYGAGDWSDSGHHDFQYEVTRILECLSTGLRYRFTQWIRQLPIPTPVTTRKRLQTIDPTARFLTFNYTSTLLELYGVPDIHVLHIHGRANHPDDNLILGHAWNPRERTSPNDRSDIDTRLTEAQGILDGYFSSTFKPSTRLIQEHHSFFEQLADVEEVYVLGHSLSTVDEPYFQALLAIPGIASARWHVACRSNSDVYANTARLLELGVQASSIVMCTWSDV